MCFPPSLTPPPTSVRNQLSPVRQVEGGLGVSRLAACLSALPPTALRVVVVGSGSSDDGGDGLEEELRGVLESRLWTDSPERTLVFAPAATESQEVKNDGTRDMRQRLSMHVLPLILERGSYIIMYDRLHHWGAVGGVYMVTSIAGISVSIFAVRFSFLTFTPPFHHFVLPL